MTKFDLAEILTKMGIPVTNGNVKVSDIDKVHKQPLQSGASKTGREGRWQYIRKILLDVLKAKVAA